MSKNVSFFDIYSPFLPLFYSPPNYPQIPQSTSISPDISVAGGFAPRSPPPCGANKTVSTWEVLENLIPLRGGFPRTSHGNASISLHRSPVRLKSAVRWCFAPDSLTFEVRGIPRTPLLWPWSCTCWTIIFRTFVPQVLHIMVQHGFSNILMAFIGQIFF